MQCRTCAAQLPAQAQVCPNCGTPVDVPDRETQLIPISNPELRNDRTSIAAQSEQPAQAMQAPMANMGQGQESQGPGMNMASSNPNLGQGPQAANSTFPGSQPQSRPFSPLSLPQSQGGMHGLTQQGQLSSPGVSAPSHPGAFPISPPPVAQSPSAAATPLTTFAPRDRPANARWKWIFAGLAIIVVLLAVGGALFTYNSMNQPTVVPRIPSGNKVNSTASRIITDAQTATALSKGSVFPAPQAITSKFKVNQTIYVTFKLNLNGLDVTKNPLYVNTKFYMGTTSLLGDDPLSIKKFAPGGYFSAAYYAPTQYGAAEIYLCHKQDCSDETLAQVVHFTIAQSKH